MNDDDIYENIRRFLPHLFSVDQSIKLSKEFGNYPDFQYFLSHSRFDSELLQGDGWKGFLVTHNNRDERRKISGVILSNSCDISSENSRIFDPNVLFCPLITLKKYERLLKKQIKDLESIYSRLNSIRRQHVTSIFYIPAKPPKLKDESIIVLDDIHRQPLSTFCVTSNEPIFTLSQCGFYIFLMKLSIHFTRVQEGVVRY